MTESPPPAAGWTRWSLSLALMVSLTIGFYDRNNITFALTDIARGLGWTEAETGAKGGALMSAFYVTYGLANMLLSPVASRRLGVRRSLLGMVVAFSIVTAITPLAARTLATFFAARFLLGITEGIHYPMMSTVTRRWFPPHERSRGTALYSAGAILSAVTAPMIIIPLKERIGWQRMFLAVSLMGAAITLPVLRRFVFDAPSEHPRIGADERRYLEHHVPVDAGPPAGDGSLRELFAVPGFPLALAGGVVGAMSGLGLLSWLPAYLEKARGVTPDELASMLAAAALSAVLGIGTFAWLSDRSRNRIQLTAGAVFVCAASTCATALAPSKGAMFASLCLTMFLVGAFNANEWAVVQRILPERRIAFGSGIYNGLTTLIGGALGPALIGGVISLTGRYSNGIVVLSGFIVATSALYFVLGRSVKY